MKYRTRLLMASLLLDGSPYCWTQKANMSFCWEPEGRYRHRRVKTLYLKCYLLLLNRTLLNSVNALLALRWEPDIASTHCVWSFDNWWPVYSWMELPIVELKRPDKNGWPRRPSRRLHSPSSYMQMSWPIFNGWAGSRTLVKEAVLIIPPHCKQNTRNGNPWG